MTRVLSATLMAFACAALLGAQGRGPAGGQRPDAAGPVGGFGTTNTLTTIPEAATKCLACTSQLPALAG